MTLLASRPARMSAATMPAAIWNLLRCQTFGARAEEPLALTTSLAGGAGDGDSKVFGLSSSVLISFTPGSTRIGVAPRRRELFGLFSGTRLPASEPGLDAPAGRREQPPKARSPYRDGPWRLRTRPGQRSARPVGSRSAPELHAWFDRRFRHRR